MAKITQLPSEQRPREKLVTLGAQSLSDSELIAIFLRTGIKGKSAIEIGKELIEKHGSLSALGRLEAKELAVEKGLGLAKASQLIACFELGARVAKEKIHKKPLNSPELIYDFLQPILGHRRTETLLVIAVDTKLNLIKYQEVSQGDVNSTVANPREILRPVILNQASGFILAHNHPSGDPSPSQADRRMTQKISDAAQIMGVTFHDHLIIGKAGENHASFFSFVEAGKL